MSLVTRALLLPLLLSLAMARAEDQAWPGVPYSYVKGYFYYPMDYGERSILQDGRLHSSVEKIVHLTTEDISALRAAIIPRPESNHFPASCYEPHHAFIFFDAAGRKPVAHVEICFLCAKARNSPTLPADDVWDMAALKALCHKLGLPVPGEAEFDAISKASRAAFEERHKPAAPHMEALEAAEKAETSPPIQHAWPWIPYRKVKICLFNEEGWHRELVSFGKLNSSITKTIELTSEQQKLVWTAFTANRPPHHITSAVKMRVGFDGTRHTVVEGLGRISNPPADSKTMRRGLICFDGDDRPVAWLAFSEKDGDRCMRPSDTDTPILNPALWDPFKLGRIFDDLGLTVPPPKDALGEITGAAPN